MPTYTAKLEVEINCPAAPADKPQFTMTLEDITKALAQASYAICALGEPRKYTSNMRITRVEIVCAACGQAVPRAP